MIKIIIIGVNARVYFVTFLNFLKPTTMKKCKKRKVWLLMDKSSKNTSKYITYTDKKIVKPNCKLVKVHDIILITTESVDTKNVSKIITGDAKTYYSDLSLIQLAEYINTDLLQISKSFYVSVKSINERLSSSYVFLKGYFAPIKVGDKFKDNLIQHLKI